MKNIISHPLFQIASFFIVLVNGAEWGAMPYGWYIIFGTADAQPFAIMGSIAVLLALACIWWWRDQLQLLSLLVMWCSLVVFFLQLNPAHRTIVFKGAVPLITALLFLTVNAFVFKEKLSWKNF